MKRMKLYLKYETKERVKKCCDLMGISHDTFYRMSIYHGCIKIMLRQEPRLRKTLDASSYVLINIPDSLHNMWKELLEGKFEINGEKTVQLIYKTKKLNGNRFMSSDFNFYSSRMFEFFVEQELYVLDKIIKSEMKLRSFDDNTAKIKSKVSISVPTCIRNNLNRIQGITGINTAQLSNYLFMVGYQEEIDMVNIRMFESESRINDLLEALNFNSKERLKIYTLLEALRKEGYVKYNFDLLKELMPEISKIYNI